MRRAITFLLLAATAAGPLAAQAWNGQGPGWADRAEGTGRRDAGRDRPDGPGDWRGAAGDPHRPDRDDRRADAPRPGDRPGWRASPGDPRRPDGGVPGRRDDPRPGGAAFGDRRDWRGPPGDFRGGGWDRDGGGRRNDYRWSENRRGGWDSRWRDDRRYDWQGYRAGNRALYRAPRYYDPRGDGYSRWSRGHRIQPAFYGRNYWISDPGRYRLPPAYGPYQWVRYYDDVALVDTRSGLIEDILYGVFWR